MVRRSFISKYLLETGRIHFETDNLIKHFESLRHQSRLPSFEDLEKVAEVLGQRHATTQAYTRARFPLKHQPSNVPAGSPWTTQNSTADIIMDDITKDDTAKNELPLPLPSEDGDLTLTNATLFMRDGIWWREVCTAIAQGDPGRVWEVMKARLYLPSNTLHFAQARKLVVDIHLCG